MIKTFESFSDREDGVKDLYDNIKNAYDFGGYQSVRILRGQMDIYESEHLDFVIFNDNYRFKTDSYGNFDIFGRISNDNNGRSNYEAELDEKEFNNVYKNCMIVLQFQQITEKYIKGSSDEERSSYFDGLERMFRDYDTWKPETFYNHYIKFFSKEPKFMKYIDWTEEKMSTLSIEEKNFVQSSIGGNKFNLFESNTGNYKVEQMLEMIKDIYGSTRNGSMWLLGGQMKVYTDTYIGIPTWNAEIYDVSYRFITNDEGKSHVSHVVDSYGNVSDEMIDNIYKNVLILYNFKKLYDIKDDNIRKPMSKELNNFMDGGDEMYDNEHPEDFYTLYMNYFQNNPKYLNLIDWPEEEVSKFTEEQKNMIRSSKGASKFKLFGE